MISMFCILYLVSIHDSPSRTISSRLTLGILHKLQERGELTCTISSRCTCCVEFRHFVATLERFIRLDSSYVSETQE